MLFSSQAFLLIFLPAIVGLFYFPGSAAARRKLILLVGSFVFYAWWDVRFVPLLAATIVLNWLLVRAYLTTKNSLIITAGVSVNLAVLGFFKYTNFVLENVLALLNVVPPEISIVLPLGISFFTFQQISYLVDVRRGQANAYPLLDFAVYVSFFPQLIAGPIVRHNQLIAQFDQRFIRHIDTECVARGMVLFALGLGKKVFLADEFGMIADSSFAAVADPAGISSVTAWQATAAFTLQLYFDFSSYSDMALGLAGIFGLTLPLNFNVPYRARDVRDFWRRWHISLSTFIRDYLYIPLGGNRRGALTLPIVLLTMTLAGLWHGAGWTFVAWGVLHGAAICIHRLWQTTAVRLPGWIGWLLTFGTWFVSMVLFRAESIADAQTIYYAMMQLDFGGADIDAWWFLAVGALLSMVGPSNVTLAGSSLAARASMGVFVAVLFVAACLRVGEGRGLEFVYFQF